MIYASKIEGGTFCDLYPVPQCQPNATITHQDKKTMFSHRETWSLTNYAA